MADRLRARGWVITINNYTDEDVERMKALKSVRYVIGGFEVGDEGTPHIQGYVLFSAQRTRRAVSKDLPRAWLQAAKGSPQENIDYCSKDKPAEDIFEVGKRPRQGARPDLDRARSLALTEGMTGVSQVCGAQGMRVAQVFLTYNEPHRDHKTEVVWLHGPSGTGKSLAAKEMAGEDVYYKNATKWWDGYDGQHTVIWDDFRGDVVALPELLRLCDRYAHRVEVKGGMRQFTSHRIIFTSILPPESMYTWTLAEPWAQLLRRLDDVQNFYSEIPTHKSGGNNDDQGRLPLTCGTRPDNVGEPVASTEIDDDDLDDILADYI